MRAVVIGGGFGGLASAAFLAKKGYDVVLVEKGCRLGAGPRLWRSADTGPR
ncbi:MAG: FAD-dependent oxidoreductase [Pyrobaculum sp.]